MASISILYAYDRYNISNAGTNILVNKSEDVNKLHYAYMMSTYISSLLVWVSIKHV